MWLPHVYLDGDSLNTGRLTIYLSKLFLDLNWVATAWTNIDIRQTLVVSLYLVCTGLMGVIYCMGFTPHSFRSFRKQNKKNEKKIRLQSSLNPNSPKIRMFMPRGSDKVPYSLEVRFFCMTLDRIESRCKANYWGRLYPVGRLKPLSYRWNETL